jgi:hypothetical protein
MVRGDTNLVQWEELQEAALLKITTLCIAARLPILRYYDPEYPALLETDVLDFAIAGILSNNFRDTSS